MNKLYMLFIMAIVLAFSSLNSSAQTLITHSESQVLLEGSVSCLSLGIISQNKFYREFDLENDFDLPDGYQIDSVQFGIELVDGVPAGGYPVTVNLYSVASPGLPSGTLTLATSTTLMIQNDSFTFVSAALPYLTDPGEVIVLEVSMEPAAPGENTRFFIGSNNLGETDDGYILSDTCGISTPTTLSSIGFPDMHMVMNLKGSPLVGIEAIQNEIAFSIYPNPNNGQFYIELEDKSVSSFAVEVSNTLGQIVLKEDYNNGRQLLDLGNVASGMYNVRVWIGDTSIHKLILIK